MNGTVTLAGLKYSTGAGAGKVLTSDASGVASWQNSAGFTLPYSGTAAQAATGALTITNSSTAFDSAGIKGISTSNTGISHGLWGESASPSGSGLYGRASATGSFTNFGVYGRADSSTGFGVYGIAGASAGATKVGVYGYSPVEGYGVYGSGPIGVYGEGPNGIYARGTGEGSAVVAYGGDYSVYGVEATCYRPGAVAVRAYTGSSTGINYGLLAVNYSPDGYGVFSIGNMVTSGTKQFQIDHPLDPENKFLNHYCAEGPEPLNVYCGVTRTDDKGYVWVQLPKYFEAINRSFRYQLTVIDDGDRSDFTLAKVSRKISGGRFQIRTSAPGVEVSWEVKATRNDRYVERYGAPVEVEKVEGQSGRYLNPELYGAPASQAMFPLPDRQTPRQSSPVPPGSTEPTK